MSELETEGWKEAAIAWSVCASIHETWAKGKDALYKTRHADFVRHADDARARALATPPSAPTEAKPAQDAVDAERWPNKYREQPQRFGPYDEDDDISNLMGDGS